MHFLRTTVQNYTSSQQIRLSYWYIWDRMYVPTCVVLFLSLPIGSLYGKCSLFWSHEFFFSLLALYQELPPEIKDRSPPLTPKTKSKIKRPFSAFQKVNIFKNICCILLLILLFIEKILTYFYAYILRLLLCVMILTPKLWNIWDGC